MSLDDDARSFGTSVIGFWSCSSCSHHCWLAMVRLVLYCARERLVEFAWLIHHHLRHGAGSCHPRYSLHGGHFGFATCHSISRRCVHSCLWEMSFPSLRLLCVRHDSSNPSLEPTPKVFASNRADDCEARSTQNNQHLHHFNSAPSRSVSNICHGLRAW